MTNASWCLAPLLLGSLLGPFSTKGRAEGSAGAIAEASDGSCAGWPWSSRWIGALAWASLAAPAFAQAAVQDADDAFGQRIGVESIGLYSESQVRGFNLQNAGNYRIEGQYFARAASPQYIIRGATVTRIGLNALRYDFPAPSGVVEFNLRSAPPGKALSIEMGSRPSPTGPFTDIIGSIGSEDGKLSLVAGLNLAPSQRYSNGAGGEDYGGGAVGRWAPNAAIQLTALMTASHSIADPDTGIQAAGEFLPPKIERGVYRGQEWTKFENRQQTGGLFGTANLGNGWRLAGGIFHSALQVERTDFHLLEAQNPSGEYNSVAIVSPRRSSSAQSASALIERAWTGGIVRHRIVATIRYRQSENATSPSLLFDTGMGSLLGVYPKIEEPEFSIGKARNLDRTTQATAGLGYRATIGGRLELRGEVQKTRYRKNRRDLAGAISEGGSDPWLYGGSASWVATDKLTVFGSFTRGLEESGVAPNGAVNRGEVLPAVIATQREVGARYTLNDRLALIAGLFDIRKDTPGISPNGRFALVGEVRHRGLEASLAGAMTPRLSVLAGIMLLDAGLSGELVDAGLIGAKPVGQSETVGLLNFGWQMKRIKGLSLDATLNHSGRAYISTRNEARSDPLTTADLGLRYAFKLRTQPVTVRARVLNLLNTFAWQADESGTLFPSEPRQYHLSIQTDL